MKRAPSRLERLRLAREPRAFAVRVAGRGLAFASAIVLARVLGVDGYGVYAFAMAWTAVLVVPSVLGFDTLLIRQVAVYVERGEPDHLRGLLRWALGVVIPLALGLCAVAGLIAAIFVDSTYAAAVLLALPIVPFRAVTAVSAAVLQGLRRTELSFVPLFIVFPLATIALVLGARALGVDVDSELAVALAAAASALALLIGAVLVRRHLAPIVAGFGARLEERRWARVLGPFTVVAILTAVSAQAGLLLLGALGSAADVGIFHAATRLAEPVGLLFTAVTLTAAPQLARLHERGDLTSMREVAGRAARLSTYYSLPIAAVVIAAQEPLLGLFGDGFGAGGTALTLLVFASLFNAFAGSVGIVLLMSGQPGPVVWAKGAALALDVTLCLVLIPSLGVEGAAIARLADFVLWNSVLAVVVWRRLRINATASPWPRAA